MSENYLEYRKQNRLCLRCVAPLQETDKQCCQDCTSNARLYMANIRKLRKSAKLCVECGDPVTSDKITCLKCIEKIKLTRKKHRENLSIRGICTHCAKYPYLPALCDASLHYKVCETCYLKCVAYDRLNDSKLWKQLQEKFYAQNKLCVYTGVELVLGGNTSLDHVKCVKDYPELKTDITNIVWTSRDINTMKWDKTVEEFIALCQAVVDHNMKISRQF